ncbi:MAG: pyridoxal-phosphate dependent enzyme [Promethearchaeia archaeon]
MFKLEKLQHHCPNCGGFLVFRPEAQTLEQGFSGLQTSKSIWDYNFSFPEIDLKYRVTLGEGNTECRPSRKFGGLFDLDNVYFKLETQNPTNSFKDRAAALLIAHARSWDFSKVVCASNGNQGASIAAYASLEGMNCVNIIPEDIDIGKRAQMVAYDSKISVKGKTVDEALKESLREKYVKNFYQCTPEFNPLTIEGQKTISFEIFDQIGVPEWIIIPMGSGGLVMSIWKGFKELKRAKIIDHFPKLVGVQTNACSPIVDSINENVDSSDISYSEDLDSYALGILVRNPLYLKPAMDAIIETGGKAVAIPENLMLTSSEELARHEGILAEPSSALTVAALNVMTQNDEISPADSVVCMITGSGLKTPYILDAISTRTKTAGMGSILSTKLKILSQISISEHRGINGSKLQEIIGNVSLSAIYQHLKDLEEKNLISRKKEGKSVLYFITERGKKVLDALDILITLL